MLKNDCPTAFCGDKNKSAFGGDVTIRHNKVLGGIGVSALSEEGDEVIGNSAIERSYGQ
jgi:uncharacterized protein GlcG (DUF336 family)